MKLLVDSDFLIAFAHPEDANHRKAVDIFKNFNKKRELLALNLVYQESTTVVSKKFGMTKARLFYERLHKLIDTKIILDQDLEYLAWKIFLKQTKKGTSFIDCANIAVMEKYHFDRILSFDRFYPRPALAPQT